MSTASNKRPELFPSSIRPTIKVAPSISLPTRQTAKSFTVPCTPACGPSLDFRSSASWSLYSPECWSTNSSGTNGRKCIGNSWNCEAAPYSGAIILHPAAAVVRIVVSLQPPITRCWPGQPGTSWMTVVTGVFTAATCTPPDRVPTERAAPADRSTAVDRRMASTQLMEVVQLIEGQPATRDGTGFRGAHLFRIAAMSAAPCEQGGHRMTLDPSS